MNDLELFFERNTGRLIDKWKHYFEIYDRYFARFRGTKVNVMEFGVSQGGSLQMWRNYFGKDANLFGVDIDPNCKQFEESGVRIFIGDQENREFLRYVASSVPQIDILIDDGGHMMNQQINTFEELFPLIAPNGVYLAEDLHTSYWGDWGGGYKRPSSFIEYSKDFVDKINAWHSHEPQRLAVSNFTRSVLGIHYYDSVLVIEKRPMERPVSKRTGQALFPDYKPDYEQHYPSLFSRLKRQFTRKQVD
jgi:hypothetical protein